MIIIGGGDAVNKKLSSCQVGGLSDSEYYDRFDLGTPKGLVFFVYLVFLSCVFRGLRYGCMSCIVFCRAKKCIFLINP